MLLETHFHTRMETFSQCLSELEVIGILFAESCVCVCVRALAGGVGRPKTREPLA